MEKRGGGGGGFMTKRPAKRSPNFSLSHSAFWAFPGQNGQLKQKKKMRLTNSAEIRIRDFVRPNVCERERGLSRALGLEDIAAAGDWNPK